MPKSKQEWNVMHPHNGLCYRCRHSWFRRDSKAPLVCPNPGCHSSLYYKRKK